MRGGNGMIRKIRFLFPIFVSVFMILILCGCFVRVYFYSDVAGNWEFSTSGGVLAEGTFYLSQVCPGNISGQLTRTSAIPAILSITGKLFPDTPNFLRFSAFLPAATQTYVFETNISAVNPTELSGSVLFDDDGILSSGSWSATKTN